MRGSWRPNRTATYWPPLLRTSVSLSRSPGLLNRKPGGPLCWVQTSSTASCHQRVWSPKFTDFLSSPSYIIVRSPTQYLWNGMFDRHQEEITAMQFTDHSVHRPVHQSMTVPWDFTLSHIVSQARQTRFLPITAIGMCHFLRVHHFGMACLAGSKVNIQHISLKCVPLWASNSWSLIVNLYTTCQVITSGFALFSCGMFF